METPQELIEQFAKGHGAVFVGEGLSIGAGLPGWSDLIKRLAAELEDCPPDASCQDVAQYYFNQQGLRHLISRLRREFDTFDLKPTNIHEILMKLPVQLFFTTNYDDLIEQAFQEKNRKFDIIVNNEDAGFFDNERLQLIKLHGDLKQPDSVVATANDHEQYFHDRSALARLLSVTLQTRTMLFIGYGATNYNFRQMLTQVRIEAGKLARNAFIITQNANQLIINDMESRNIRVINLVSSETRTSNQEALATWLEKFSQRLTGDVGPVIQPQKPRKLPPQPYKFLDYFNEEDSAIFFGRKQEKTKLIRLILTYPLIILYGGSGSGKTSLLKASVIPYIRENEGFFVAYARPLSDPLSEIKNAILNLRREHGNLNTKTTRLRALIETTLSPGERLLIVLDQFEEFFIRQGAETRKQFLDEFFELINDPPREVRCVLSLRSDYLDRLDEIKLPHHQDPLRHRMRLYDLGPSAANAAIIEPAKAFNIEVEVALVEFLLKDLKQVDIAPSQLQIVCYILWGNRERPADQKERMTLSKYLDLGKTNAILKIYLKDVIDGLEETEVQEEYGVTIDGKQAQDAARTILKSMISSEKTKVAANLKEITRNEIHGDINIDDAQLETLLAYLVDRRIIRRLPDSDQYELAHEVMVEKIWKWVDQKERYLMDLKDTLAAATNDYRKFKSLLQPERLKLLIEKADHLTPDQDALELLIVSSINHGMDSEE